MSKGFQFSISGFQWQTMSLNSENRKLKTENRWPHLLGKGVPAILYTLPGGMELHKVPEQAE